MTWNIHKGVGGVDRRYDLARIQAVLSYYDPDIALLQEVAQDIPRLRKDDQAALLHASFGGHCVFHAEHRFAEGHYGNLILSRWPLRETAHLDLTIGWRKQRGMQQAEVAARWNGHARRLMVHNLHLGLAGSERNQQLARVVRSDAFAAIPQGTAAILGGDLNDLWGSLGPKHLLPAGLHRAGPLSNTFPAAYPLRPLDGVFFSGGLRVRHAHIGLSRLTRAASDHLPVIADYVLD
jgi:endonuclease/exonuclease/phosphatase family metal-dependent hydrolase